MSNDPIGGLTLNQALDQFIEWGSAKYAPRTVETYSDLIRRFIRSVGNKRVGDVDIILIQGYYVQLKKQGYHESTIAFSLIAVRQMFRYLFLRGVVKWDYQLIPVPKYVSNSHKPVGKEIVQTMINNINRKDFIGLRDAVILSFLYDSGVRVSELCDLKVEDIDPDKFYTSIISKKNRKRRMIFWTGNTAALLSRYMTLRERFATSDAFIVSVDRRNPGKRLTPRSVERIVAKLRPHDWVRPHGFRHGLGQDAMMARSHPRHAKDWLGHKNINSTQVYMQMYDGALVDAYGEMSNKRGQLCLTRFSKNVSATKRRVTSVTRRRRAIKRTGSAIVATREIT